MSRIGLVITTFNSQSYFDTLFNSIPLEKIDHLVIVNGGEEYTQNYAAISSKIKWIQHDTVKFASVARNDGLKYLQEQECDYYFICEDDMIILDPDIFQAYINASKLSGIEYLCYASNAWETGPRFARTPKLQVQYSHDTIINLYAHTCNEFTFRTKRMLENAGLYDEQLRCMFDIDSIIRMCNTLLCPPFWNFPDISDSDRYITNNPDAISRMNANGERAATLGPEFKLIHDKSGRGINEIPNLSKNEVIERLQQIKNTFKL